ncbi:MAG TPA: PDZ domain-containing protein [Polyangiales bacterium]|nr:PDZ domain-containing protein [Polyangiales bacterium]
MRKTWSIFSDGGRLLGMWLLRLLLALCVISGCAYPRRTTLVHAAPASAEPLDTPSGLWSIRLVEAQLPETKGGGLPWDSDGTGPDPYIRLVVDNRVVWESPVQQNTLNPKWNVTLPRSVQVPAASKFRLEMWDDDTASADPAGAFAHQGLPENALPNARATMRLDNLGTVTIMISSPKPWKGLGVTYEQHGDALVVLAVEPFSPAARAGIAVGDRVVAIGDTRVETLTAARAASDLSLAVDRGALLTVADQHGKERAVNLDRGFLWLTM